MLCVVYMFTHLGVLECFFTGLFKVSFIQEHISLRGACCTNIQVSLEPIGSLMIGCRRYNDILWMGIPGRGCCPDSVLPPLAGVNIV